MNQRPSGSLVLSKAITGFASFKSAQGLSDRTIDSYDRQLQKWIEQQGDLPVHQVTLKDIIAYLDWLRSEYVPHRFGKSTEPLSPKTLRNVW
jgi:integrase/recombinase XerD